MTVLGGCTLYALVLPLVLGYRVHIRRVAGPTGHYPHGFTLTTSTVWSDLAGPYFPAVVMLRLWLTFTLDWLSCVDVGCVGLDHLVPLLWTVFSRLGYPCCVTVWSRHARVLYLGWTVPLRMFAGT